MKPQCARKALISSNGPSTPFGASCTHAESTQQSGYVSGGLCPAPCSKSRQCACSTACADGACCFGATSIAKVLSRLHLLQQRPHNVRPAVSTGDHHRHSSTLCCRHIAYSSSYFVRELRSCQVRSRWWRARCGGNNLIGAHQPSPAVAELNNTDRRVRLQQNLLPLTTCVGALARVVSFTAARRFVEQQRVGFVGSST